MGAAICVREEKRADMNRQFHVDYAGQAIVYMASLPLGVNVLNQVRSPSPHRL